MPPFDFTVRNFFLLTALLFSFLQADAQDYWIQRDSIKGPKKSVASAFSANGVGYILCGLESTGFTRKMFSYDVNQDDWDSAHALGGINGGGLSRGSACSFSVYNKGYICLGQGDNTNYLDDVWEYDPALDVWTQKANFAGGARRAATAFVIGGFAYVGTGQNAAGLCDDFYKYDPINNQWSAIADFAGTPRKYAVGFGMGNQGYVGTGDDGTMRNDFWQYQPSLNTWTAKANFPGTARAGAVGWGIFPQGFIATGEDYTYSYCNDVWEYNYFTNQWIQRASLIASGRKHAVAFTIGNVAYLGAGYNGALLDDFYSYQGITGIADAKLDAAPVVYPNPSIGLFTITSAIISLDDCTLRFSDEAGRDVTSSFGITHEDGSVKVNGSSVAAGVYYLTTLNDQGITFGSVSLVIQR